MIDNLRKRISEIDRKIEELLLERFKIVREIGEIKKKEGKEVVVPEVEWRKLQPIHPDARPVFHRIFQVSRHIQSSKVGALGPKGSVSHSAAMKVAEEVVLADSIPDVFDLLDKGVPEVVVPMENKRAGTVRETLHEIISRNVWITGEFNFRVEFCLAGFGTEKVISHPKAIEQCSRFLKSIDAEVEYSKSTTSAIPYLKEGESVICTREAAEIYGLPILAESIQDDPENETRFILASKLPRFGRQVSSFVFNVENRPGALKDALERIAEAGINLRKIESWPAGNWEYSFYAEAEGDIREVDFRGAVKSLRVLGVYDRVV